MALGLFSKDLHKVCYTPIFYLLKGDRKFEALGFIVREFLNPKPCVYLVLGWKPRHQDGPLVFLGGYSRVPS